MPLSFDTGNEGSSPRIRGEWIESRHQCSTVGIIPANTGRMGFSMHPLRHGPDHPREYGENCSKAGQTWRRTGSSPRIRGESAAPVRFVVDTGIIPANTGRISSCSFSIVAHWDHPREYGENFRGTREELHQLGSSPRIRGECTKQTHGFADARIIPANTGRIGKAWTASDSEPDHPREYGENTC